MIVAIVCLVAPVVVPVLILAVAALLDYRSKAATVEPSYPAQKYEIPNLSALTRPLALKKFTVEGVSWCISLEPSSDHKFPGIFLKRCTRRSPPLRVKLSVTFVHPENPDRNQLDGLEAIYYDEPIGWPAWHLAEAEPTLPGLILDDKIVLQTHVWVSKDLNPGSASMPVLEESKILRTRALVEMLSDSGENRLEPDVMLKLGDDMLPAHSAFLAQSSGYFKAKFQSAMTGSKNNIVDIQDVAAEDIKVVVRYMYGELDAIPEDRLHSLVLATKRMQVRELMERCVNLLKIRLTLDSFEETAMLANQVDNHGLYMACVEFVVSAWKEDRSALSLIKHGVLNRILATAPDLASRLIGDILERIVPKKTGK